MEKEEFDGVMRYY